MKKIYYISCVIAMIFFSIACSKNEIEYDSYDLPSGMAEFQLHYVAPVLSSTDNYIYRIEVNDSLYSNETASLVPYNAVPNGSVSRFFIAKGGSTNIKLYTGKITHTLVYNQSCSLTADKKQNVFVYDLNQPPIVFDNEFPYQANTTMNTDSTAWIKFYNFMYENATTPTSYKLQYQYYYTDPTTKVKSDVMNIGNPVAFGETTGWVPVKVKKTIFNSSGNISLYYLIKVIDDSGNVVGDLQVVNSKGKTVTYSDYWTAYIGRRYHHVFCGIRTVKSPNVGVKVFTAL